MRLGDLGFRVRVSRHNGQTELTPRRLAFVAGKLET
jgi:hypothetical protein